MIAGTVSAEGGGIATATDCARELVRIDSMLTSFSAARAVGADADCQVAHLWLQRARISGVPSELRAAKLMVDAALQRHSDWPDLCFLRAGLDLDLHRAGHVRDHLDRVPGLLESPAAIELLAAADTQLGCYAVAERRYLDVIAVDPSWQALAGLAQLHALRGDRMSADAHLVAAEDEVTAKQMRAFSWLRVRRGELAALAGDFDLARAHYDTAGRAYSGYWLVESHVAGLLHRQGRLDEAAAAYATLHARVNRPELAERLGDVYRDCGDLETAHQWYDVGLTTYLESAARGEGLYLHHLAHYYVAVARDDATAAHWAARDHAFRHDRMPVTTARRRSPATRVEVNAEFCIDRGVPLTPK